MALVHDKAVQMYREAADRGDPQALFMLGLSMWDGVVVAKNRAVTLQVLRVATVQGSSSAERLLAAVDS